MACKTIDIEKENTDDEHKFYYNLRIITLFGIIQFIFGCTFIVFGQVVEESQINHNCTYNTTIWCPILFAILAFIILMIAYSDQRNPSPDNRYLYVLTALTLLQIPVAFMLCLGSFSHRCSASYMGISGGFAMLQFFFGTVQVAVSLFSSVHILAVYCDCSSKKTPNGDFDYTKEEMKNSSPSWTYDKGANYDSVPYVHSNDSTIDSGRGSTSSADGHSVSESRREKF